MRYDHRGGEKKARRQSTRGLSCIARCSSSPLSLSTYKMSYHRSSASGKRPVDPSHESPPSRRQSPFQVSTTTCNFHACSQLAECTHPTLKRAQSVLAESKAAPSNKILPNKAHASKKAPASCTKSQPKATVSHRQPPSATVSHQKPPLARLAATRHKGNRTRDPTLKTPTIYHYATPACSSDTPSHLA